MKLPKNGPLPKLHVTKSCTARLEAGACRALILSKSALRDAGAKQQVTMLDMPQRDAQAHVQPRFGIATRSDTQGPKLLLCSLSFPATAVAINSPPRSRRPEPLLAVEPRGHQAVGTAAAILSSVTGGVAVEGLPRTRGQLVKPQEAAAGAVSGF